MILKARGMISRVDWRVWAGFAICIAFLGLAFVSYVNYQNGKITDNIEQRSERKNDQVKALMTKNASQDARLADTATALEAQRRQFQECKDKSSDEDGCKRPVSPKPELIVGQAGKQGPTPSLSSLLLLARQAQSEYCQENRCSGRDGKTPSASQLLEIITPLIPRYVAVYCEANNNCRGEDGVDGTNGVNGGKGDRGDKGEQGEKGTDGEDGAPGPACPPGYQTAETTVVTDTGPKTILACQASIPDPPTEGETE